MAYAGLCLGDAISAKITTAYFYCGRALQLRPITQPEQADVLSVLALLYQVREQDNSKPEEDDGGKDVWHCDPWTTFVSFDQHGVPNITRKLSKGSHESLVARYYREADLISDNHEKYRCEVAEAAYASRGDKTALETMSTDVAPHLLLARKYLRWAQALKDRDRSYAYAPVFFALALEEFRWVDKVDSTAVEALIGYAHTFFTWTLDAAVNPPFPGPNKTYAVLARNYINPPFRGPNETYADLARNYAHRAIKIAHAEGNDVAEASAHSALGEVLFAGGDFINAFFELKQGLNASRFDLNETRWVLAQADRCLDHEKEASRQLKAIEESEAPRDIRSFADDSKIGSFDNSFAKALSRRLCQKFSTGH
jgi:hypothetical protein